MKLSVLKRVEIEVKSVRVCVPVHYEEEDIPSNFPLRNGDEWAGTIDIETGKIKEWPEGAKGGRMYMKVCDSGTYTLLSESGSEVSKVSDYAPSCIPGEYGDYIELDISDDGVIRNWNPRADFSDMIPDQY